MSEGLEGIEQEIIDTACRWARGLASDDRMASVVERYERAMVEKPHWGNIHGGTLGDPYAPIKEQDDE